MKVVTTIKRHGKLIAELPGWVFPILVTLYFLVWLALSAGVVWAAVHFIRKFW